MSNVVAFPGPWRGAVVIKKPAQNYAAPGEYETRLKCIQALDAIRGMNMRSLVIVAELDDDSMLISSSHYDALDDVQKLEAAAEFIMDGCSGFEVIDI